jgi:hypothetical protein
MTLGSEEVTRRMFVWPMKFVETLTGRKIGAGTLLSKAQKATKAFEPLTIRGITFQNRIWVRTERLYVLEEFKSLIDTA